jgi:hypothetical protein
MAKNLTPVACPALVGSFTAAIDLSTLDLSASSGLMIGFEGASASDVFAPYFAMDNTLTPSFLGLGTGLNGLAPAPNTPQDQTNVPVLQGPGPFAIPFGPPGGAFGSGSPAPGIFLYVGWRASAPVPTAGIMIQVSGQDA